MSCESVATQAWHNCTDVTRLLIGIGASTYAHLHGQRFAQQASCRLQASIFAARTQSCARLVAEFMNIPRCQHLLVLNGGLPRACARGPEA